MKTNFEKHIQDKFANHEFSYDANAWTSLSKELDKKMPTSRKSNTKWWLTSMLIIATTISGIYVFKTSNSTNQKVISKTLWGSISISISLFQITLIYIYIY